MGDQNLTMITNSLLNIKFAKYVVSFSWPCSFLDLECESYEVTEFTF